MLDLFKRKEKNEANPVCDHCKMEFPDKTHLDKHKKIAHPKGR